MKAEILKWAIVIAGIGQVATAFLYPFVRYKVLDWFTDLEHLKPLNAAIARTYGYYIQGINFCFGLLSILLLKDLLIVSNLALAISAFIAVYWWGRISFQLKDYSYKDLSPTKSITAGVRTMNLLITYFALTYTILFFFLLKQL